MKPVMMPQWGDCFSACVASILELPMTEMPTVPTHIEELNKRLREIYPWRVEHREDGDYAVFDPPVPTETVLPYLAAWIEETRDRYNREFNEIWSAWFAARNLVCTMLDEKPTDGYCIAAGRYKEFSHALVLLDGKPVHDPEGYPADKPEVPWEYERFYVIKSKTAPARWAL